jgi:hypothetical protein
VKSLIYTIPFTLLLACNNSAQQNQQGNTVVVNPTTQIPVKREKVNPEPVAVYKQRVPDELNEWYFTVRIYETPATFEYTVKIQYQELRAEDNFTIPNLGIMPAVQLKQGADPYTCIIGFPDKENNFKEYKQVTAKNGKVKITTIGHYAVTTASHAQ